MPDLSYLRQHAINPPPNWNLLGGREDYLALAPAWQEQIIFLDQETSDKLYAYFNALGLHTGRLWDPYAQQNFRYRSKFDLKAGPSGLKKWLYQRGLPFAHWVYVLPNYGEPPLAMTWKMVIKFCKEMLFGDDVVFFDDSHQWCLTYWHEDWLFWGSQTRE